MKLYINEKGEKKHFVGVIPDGWREVTPEEIQQAEAEKQQIETILSKLTAIYDVQDEFLKAMFEPARSKFVQLYAAGEINKAISILTSPYIAKDVKPIAQAIYNKYIELKGE